LLIIEHFIRQHNRGCDKRFNRAKVAFYIYEERLFLKEVLVVLYSQSPWDDPPRIRHQVARELAKHFKVMYLEVPLPRGKRHGTMVEDKGGNIKRVAITNYFEPPFRIKSMIPGLTGALEGYYLGVLKGILSPYKSFKKILISFDYNFQAFMRDKIFDFKVYFCNDDFSHSSNNNRINAIVSNMEKNVATSADCCFAVSHPLVEKIKAFNADTTLFFPGGEEVGSDGEFVPRPVASPIKVGYLGYINERIEYEWIKYAAENSDIEMHLAGPVTHNKAKWEELGKTGKVKFYDSLLGGQVGDFLRKMDVLIVPYVRGPMVDAISVPNKFFNYLSAGKPVVISDLPHFHDFGPGIVYKANSRETFLETLKKADKENCRELFDKRRAIASENTWTKKGEFLKDLIEKRLDEMRGRI
jgi:hypothetical protein